MKYTLFMFLRLLSSNLSTSETLKIKIRQYLTKICISKKGTQQNVLMYTKSYGIVMWCKWQGSCWWNQPRFHQNFYPMHESSLAGSYNRLWWSQRLSKIEKVKVMEKIWYKMSRNSMPEQQNIRRLQKDHLVKFCAFFS